MVETLDDQIEYFIDELIKEKYKGKKKYTEKEIIEALEKNLGRLKGEEVDYPI